MYRARLCVLCVALMGFVAVPAVASICDYRPSVVVGQGVASTLGGAAAGAATTGTAMKAAGFYTLVHAGSGMTMLGSTVAGASAAGTVGIIGGTAGAVGTIGAILMAPATIVAGVVTAAGIGGLEAACYFTDERITAYDDVLSFMQHLSHHHPEDRFQLITGIPGREDDAIRIWNADTGELDRYLVSTLYIVNGTLMHRKWGPNRNLGYIAFVPTLED